MKRDMGQFVVTMGNGFCALGCLVGTSEHQDLVSRVSSLRERTGWASAEATTGICSGSPEAGKATSEKPSLALFVSRFCSLAAQD